MGRSARTSSPNILLIHFHSVRNAGDLAQLRGTIQDLQRWFHSPKIKIASNYPDEKILENSEVAIVPSIFHNVGMGSGRSKARMLTEFIRSLILIIAEQFSKTRDRYSFLANEDWRTLIRSYREADIVISVPGNIFFTMGRFGFPFLVSYFAVLFAVINKKALYVMSQSIGPLARWWERILVRHIYKNARMVFVRESISFDLAGNIGIPTHLLYLHTDQVLMSSDTTINPRKDLLLKFGINSPAIGVTVIPRMVRTLRQDKLRNYYRVLANALTDLVAKHGHNIYFFPQVTGPTRMEDDRIAARNVAALMECPPNQVFLIEDNLTDIELRSLYAAMELFVASRLHSGIFALLSGVPTLLIGYLPKALGIMNAIDLGDSYIDLDSVSRDELVSKAELLLANRSRVSKEILKKISQSIDHLSPAAKLIAKNYYGEE